MNVNKVNIKNIDYYLAEYYPLLKTYIMKGAVMTNNPKRVLIPLAEGFEEIEALAVVDILRRAHIEVITATIGSDASMAVTGRSNISVLADSSLEDVLETDFDMIVLPGGQPGTNNLKDDDRIKTVIEKMHDEDKFVAAICAAPTILSALGIIDGINITSHPTVKESLSETNYKEDRVVVDSKIITSRGPGTAIEFALKLIEILINKDKAEEVNKGVMANL